jgi:aldehyde dehydrogenase (NAD+)
MSNQSVSLPDASRRTHYIGGTWAPTAPAAFEYPIYDPATESLLCAVPEATASDVDRAVLHARAVFDDPESAWNRLTATGRGKLLYRLADIIESKAAYMAYLVSLNLGKATPEAEYDILGTVNCLRYYAGYADKLHGKVIDVDVPDVFCWTRREPLGVCGLIVPWNFFFILAWKLAPALAAGNVVICKPAESTPIPVMAFMECVHEAGFPPGVVQCVYGRGIVTGDALVRHSGVDKIAFTGSTPVGKSIAKLCSDSLKKVALELGGKSPTIIFDSADLDAALAWAFMGTFLNNGQCCCAGTRVYVHRNIFDEFVRKVTEMANSKQLGAPTAKGTDYGPLVSKEHYGRVVTFIEEAVRNANQEYQVLCGGKPVPGQQGVPSKGYYVRPTVIVCNSDKARLAREEVFGPVMCVFVFDSEAEVVARANDSAFGLAAAVFSRDHQQCMRVSARLRAGTVWINQYNIVPVQAPFGGYKESGNGRDLGKAALEGYTQYKSVISKL